jgi:hypothetical protein
MAKKKVSAEKAEGGNDSHLYTREREIESVHSLE